MARKKLSAEALALIYLREERRWTQKALAAAKGFVDYRPISRYESGVNLLSRRELDEMASLMGFSREAVDALVFVYTLVSPPQAPTSRLPIELTPEELGRIDRAVIADGWVRAADLRARLIENKKQRKVEADRKEAGELWARLKKLPRAARREAVEDAPELHAWALVPRLCDESRKAAAHDPQEAIHLTDLALVIARQMSAEGEEWGSALLGYAWAFRGNAFRVAGDLVKAGEAFVRARQLWAASAGVGSALLPEWRIDSLEASLRREERRFPEALELLAQAERGAQGDSVEMASILLKKEFVFEQMGDFEGALAALREAAPYIENAGEARLVFGSRFETVKALCALERYDQAEPLLEGVRKLAEGLGNGLDLVRVVWLKAKVAAGLGKRSEALAGLEQVRREFTVRGIPYDAALSSLELAVLYLEEGRSQEVKALAREMAPIFHAQGIAREALAALSVFLEAAQREAATLEMVKHVMADIVAARQSTHRLTERERG